MGWSAPNSQAQSRNSSGTSSIGTIPLQRPTKIPRSQRSVPVSAAITAMSKIAEQPTIVSISSSFVSTSTRQARLASALAKLATAQSRYELAKANQEVAEAHEEALAQSQAGSIVVIGDVQSEGGDSPRARRGSSTAMAVPPPIRKFSTRASVPRSPIKHVVGRPWLTCGIGKRGPGDHRPASTECIRRVLARVSCNEGMAETDRC
mgnify:CR=1 FL=1